MPAKRRRAIRAPLFRATGGRAATDMGNVG
jgi:hypothetical protein